MLRSAYTFGESKAGNDGTSSQAASNWGYNYSSDINGEELSYSNFDMRHRIIGQLNYRVEYAKHFATTIGIIYNGSRVVATRSFTTVTPTVTLVRSLVCAMTSLTSPRGRSR